MRRLRDNLPLLLILLLALLWRLLLWSQPLHAPANDEFEYLRVAQDLLQGRGWVFYESWRWLRAPLYPLFLAGSLWLTGGDLHLAALPNLLLSVGVVLLIYKLGRELSPMQQRRPALIAAAIAALLQTHATFVSLYMSETLFSLLFGAGLLVLARWRRQGGWGRAILAGLLLGLASLTRSAGLMLLPLAALWMAWPGLTTPEVRQEANEQLPGAPPRKAGIAERVLPLLLPGLLLIGGATLVIAPWTLHNCRTYGRCILIETGAAYNLWAFYEPREEIETINRSLEALANPAERADEATRRGLARLREDPSIILRKLPAEWVRLWAIKPIQDRFLLAAWYGDPPPLIFIAALLFDDLLYLLILLAAPFGLALGLQRRDALSVLLALWLAAFVGTTLVTHAEGRYRHFLFVALIPLAGVALDAALRRTRLHPLPTLAASGLLLLALLPLFSYYPWTWAAQGAQRSYHRAVGDMLAAAGRTEAAAGAYRQALAAEVTPDGWIALGDLYRRAGDNEAALAAYREAQASQPTYVAASALLGDMLRELGRAEEAQRAFRGRYLDLQRLSEWSFLRLNPLPQASLDLGNGLDYGYIGGFFKAETIVGATARWTNGRGSLRLHSPAGSEGSRILALRVAAPRPDSAAVPLQICAGGRCTRVEPEQGWRTLLVLLPPGDDAIVLSSPTFYAADGRDLGVLVDRAHMFSPMPHAPSPIPLSEPGAYHAKSRLRSFTFVPVGPGRSRSSRAAKKG